MEATAVAGGGGPDDYDDDGIQEECRVWDICDDGKRVLTKKKKTPKKFLGRYIL